MGCETLGEGLGPLGSLALPYFNSEDSQKIYHLKSNSSKCCFLLYLVRANRNPHCFREKKEMENLFSKHRCSFLVILYMNMMSQLVSMSKRCKFCHLYACYAYFLKIKNQNP